MPRLSLMLAAGTLSALVAAGCQQSSANSGVLDPRAENQKTPAPATTAKKKETAVPRKPAATSGKPREITFDAIKFEMKKGEPFLRSMLTPQIEAMNGQAVRVRGYMLPSFQQTGITQFVLVRDNMQCCFGPGAALYDCIVVDMRPGKSTDYSVRPVTVTGQFSVRELLDPDGKHLAIYHLEGESVQ